MQSRSGPDGVQQDDVDAGIVVNTATAIAQEPSGADVSASDTETTLGEQTPSIDLDKLTPLGTLVVGEELDYFFEVTNTGNVTLTSVSVDDSITTPVVCTAQTLAPEDATLCAATYIVTQADADAGQITNTATASGTPPNGDPVTAVDTEITALPTNASIALDKQDPTGSIALGESLTYNFVVRNTGNLTLTAVAIDDPLANPVTCDADTLIPDAETSCSATYIVTQDDVDAGQITNTATATGQPPIGNAVTSVDTVTTAVPQNPSISLTKSGPGQPMTLNAAVTYSFEVQNTGDVTLDDVGVDDPLVGLVTCDVTTLAPGEIANCSGDYTVTQSDIDAGSRSNTATASGRDPGGSPTTDTDSIVTAIPQVPAITLDKESSASGLIEGETIGFTFEVTNTGDVTLSDVSVADTQTTGVVCPVTILTPSESTTCTANYTVTLADVNAGEIINTATATGTPPLTDPISVSDVEIVQGNPDPSIDLDKSAGPGPFSYGSIIDYSFVVTNTGNQTLNNVVVTDPLVGAVTCPTQLDPGEVAICTASYSATQADVDAGTITNQAIVEGFDPSGVLRRDVDVEIVALEQVAQIALDKQAPIGVLTVGGTVTYPFVVTNSGTVTLVNVRVDDPLVGTVTCDVQILQPAESTNCAGTYVVTQADMNAGQIVNTAIAAGDTPTGSASSTDTETTPLVQQPSIALTKRGPTASIAVGETLRYTLTVLNDGNVSLATIAVSDPLASVTCPLDALEPNESMICTANYVSTQADFDTGEIINTATVSARARSATISLPKTRLSRQRCRHRLSYSTRKQPLVHSPPAR